MGKIRNLNDLVESAKEIYRDAFGVAPTTKDVMDELVRLSREQTGQLNEQLNALAGNPYGVQAPLRDEKGRAYGYVRAEIPEKLLFHYMQPKHCGGLGLSAEEATQYILKKFPELKVRTRMKPRFHGANFPTPARPGRVNFGPGTMRFAG